MAKFKVGDIVSVKREAAEMIDNPALARKRGKVTKVLPGGYYEVDGELGATGLDLTDEELTLANAKSCNAKFQVGDRVEITAGSKAGKQGKIEANMPGPQGGEMYHIRLEDGMLTDCAERNLKAVNAVRSTNSVVRNAKDAEGSVIRVGDTVISVYEEEEDNPKEYKVKGISGSYVYLDDGRHEYDKDLLVYNSRRNSTNRVVRNAIKAVAKNELTPYGAIHGMVALHGYGIDDKGNGVFIVKAPPEKIKELAKTGPYSIYPFEVVPFGRGWSKVTASTKLNACGTARNREAALDVAYKAGNAFKSAYNELAACEGYLRRIASIGLPNDLSGNDEKTAEWAKKKAQKVREIMDKLDQGRL